MDARSTAPGHREPVVPDARSPAPLPLLGAWRRRRSDRVPDRPAEWPPEAAQSTIDRGQERGAPDRRPDQSLPRGGELQLGHGGGPAPQPRWVARTAQRPGLAARPARTAPESAGRLAPA